MLVNFGGSNSKLAAKHQWPPVKDHSTNSQKSLSSVNFAICSQSSVLVWFLFTDGAYWIISYNWPTALFNRAVSRAISRILQSANSIMRVKYCIAQLLVAEVNGLRLGGLTIIRINYFLTRYESSGWALVTRNVTILQCFREMRVSRQMMLLSGGRDFMVWAYTLIAVT